MPNLMARKRLAEWLTLTLEFRQFSVFDFIQQTIGILQDKLARMFFRRRR
jgi:hypothetical protein